METPFDPQVIAQRRNNTATIGMLLFLASWAMMFAACFYSYINLRIAGGGWPPDGMPDLPVKLPAVNTLLLGLSSLTLHWAIEAAKKDQTKKLVRLLVGTLFLGALFFILQVVLWRSMMGQNLTHQTGSYGSSFYFVTGFHALHVIVGLGMLLFQTIKSARGRISAESHHGLKLVAMFWHFVDIAWVGTFIMVFLA